MKSLKVIGFGILIWVVAFMVISVFIGFKVSTDSVAVKIITILSVFVATLLIAKNLKAKHAGKSPYNWHNLGCCWICFGCYYNH